MLTRLKVSGFKNLVDVDVRFGPFTCVAGANGVGKSNLFDAIRFLSALAEERSLIQAALSVRDEESRTGDIRSLFHRVGDKYTDEMSFEAEMIVPAEGVDDLGQEAKASITFLRYSITLAYRRDDGIRSLGSLELLEEKLSHINLGEASKHLLFPHEPSWRKSAVKGRRTSAFISTEVEGPNRIIKLHQDKGKDSSGRPRSLLAVNLQRTVLSDANASENRTALLARREMQSWRLLQLEPSALGKPDEFIAPTKLGADGSHLAATLYHLAHSKPRLDRQAEEESVSQLYTQVANRLAELIDDVYEVGIDRDEQRQLLTLQVTDRDGTTYPARALSDGTLRFLALAVLELDPEAKGLICLEEPENGIHPKRIPAILELLQDLAVDINEPIGPDNPLRQIIINTHSPAVVEQVPPDSLLFAESKELIQSKQQFKGVKFSCLSDTWRQRDPNTSIVSMGDLLYYLNPVVLDESESDGNGKSTRLRQKSKLPHEIRRVVDRPDVRQLLLFPGELG